MFAHPFANVENIGGRQAPDTDELRLFPIETYVGIVILRPHLHIRHVLQADEHASLLFDDKLTEFFRGCEVGVGDQIDCRHRSLGFA